MHSGGGLTSGKQTPTKMKLTGISESRTPEAQNKSEGLRWEMNSRWTYLLAQNTSHPLRKAKAGGENREPSNIWVVLDISEGI